MEDAVSSKGSWEQVGDIGMAQTIAVKIPQHVVPSVSVLLPVHNAEATIDRAIRSIAWQQKVPLSSIEVVIVDDGSTDGTSDVLKRCQLDYACHFHVEIVTLPENQGVARALNEGLSRCRGRFVARQDADDISHPQRFALQVEFLLANPSIDILGSGAITFNDEAWKLERTTKSCTGSNGLPPVSCCGRAVSMQPHPCLIRAMLPTECPLLHPSVMMRREALLRKQMQIGRTQQVHPLMNDPPVDPAVGTDESAAHGTRQMQRLQSTQGHPLAVYPEEAIASEDYALWCEVLANKGRHQSILSTSTLDEVGDSQPLLAANLGRPLIYLSIRATSHSRDPSIKAARDASRFAAAAGCVRSSPSPQLPAADHVAADHVDARHEAVGKILLDPECCSPVGLFILGTESIAEAVDGLKQYRDAVLASCKPV